MNSLAKIRDEERLLLTLCRLEFSDVQTKNIRSLAAEISDWNYFSILANSHGVAALVRHNLEKLSLIDMVPEETAIFLRGALMKSLTRNTFNTETVGEVLRLLNREKIKTVFLKGLALELSVYGNAGLRQMSDVDILISREQCIKARDILLDNGYVSLPVKSAFHKLIIADTGKHLPSLTKNGTSIEIHHELFGGKRNSLTRILFDTSYPFELKGERVFIPKPQIFFLYLVRHLWLHEINNESQLRLYTDLVVLIEKYSDEILNNDLLTYASKAGMSETLARCLNPLRDFMGIHLPESINNFIDKRTDPASGDKFIFFLKSPKNNLPVNNSRFYRNAVSEIPGLHRKFLFLMGDIFPSVSFMKKRYGLSQSWKVLFYYPHRLGKVLWLFKR
jgi:hypothetical protein